MDAADGPQDPASALDLRRLPDSIAVDTAQGE